MEARTFRTQLLPVWRSQGVGCFGGAELTCGVPVLQTVQFTSAQAPIAVPPEGKHLSFFDQDLTGFRRADATEKPANSHLEALAIVPGRAGGKAPVLITCWSAHMLVLSPLADGLL